MIDQQQQGNTKVKKANIGVKGKYWHPDVVFKAIKGLDQSVVWRKKSAFTFELGQNYFIDGILNERYIDSKRNEVETDPGAIFNPRDAEWRHSVAVVSHRQSHVVCCRGLPDGRAPVCILGLRKDGTIRKKAYFFKILKVYEAHLGSSKSVPIRENWEIMEEENPNKKQKKKRRKFWKSLSKIKRVKLFFDLHFYFDIKTKKKTHVKKKKQAFFF